MISLNLKAFNDVELTKNDIYMQSYTFDEIIKNENLSSKKIDKKEIEKSKNKVLASTTRSSTEDAEYERAYGYTEYIYIQSDSNNEYIIANQYYMNPPYYEIVKHNIKNNTNTTIYQSNNSFEPKYVTSKNNIIYIEQVPSGTKGCTSVNIIGFDITKNEVVFNKNFNVSIPEDANYHTFTVDSKGRFYFTYNYTGLKIFDNNAKVIYDKKPITPTDGKKYEVVLHSIAPNDDGIIYSIGYYPSSSNYLRILQPGYQKLNANGTLTKSDYTLFNDTSSVIKDPDWKFIDAKGIYAVDQYGRIAKFEYVNVSEKVPAGVKISIVQDSKREINDSYWGELYNPPYAVKNNLLYLLGSNNIVFVYDINKNFERVGKYTTSIPDDNSTLIERVAVIEDKIYVKYYGNSTILEKKINISDIEKFKNIWYKEHLTQKHTIQQIQDKYNSLKPTFDYSKSQFDIEPSSKAPYVAGKLKAGVIQDTLNQINYYRWLYGVNSVTLNQEKMERNQKGAVIQAATNTLTHWPVKPADMDEAFYKEAYAGCNGGYSTEEWYSGNCSQGDRSTTASIKGYINDLNNVSEGSYVGHRLSLLGLDVIKTSFGYCGDYGYTTVSMYHTDELNNNNEKFYSYPPAGNFPMQNFTTHEYWSLTVNENYDIEKMKLQFTYNNKTYNQDWFDTERNSIIFKLPDNLIEELGGVWKTMPKSKINVKLTGLIDENGDTANFNYDVNFFDINEKIIPITGISFTNSSKDDYVGNTKVVQNLIINPANANEEYTIKWSSSNTDVATVDANGKITCKKVGTTVIKAQVGKFSASYTLNVKEKPAFILGDVNNDGTINTLDAVIILQYSAKKIKLNEVQLQAGDVNKDGTVNTLDAMRILQYSAKKITSL